MHAIIDKTILASRWLLAVFLLGLVLGLVVYAVQFLLKLWKFAAASLSGNDTALLIQLLHLLDAALVASLVVTVIISSYDSLVSRLSSEEGDGKASWVATVDPGNLKIKLSAALIAISSIHLLQIFMEVREYDDRSIMWALALHSMFLAGALVLGLLDRLTAASKKGKA